MTDYFVKTADRTWSLPPHPHHFQLGLFAIYKLPIVLINVEEHFKNEVIIHHEQKYVSDATLLEVKCSLTFKTDEAEAEFLMLYAAGTFNV